MPQQPPQLSGPQRPLPGGDAGQLLIAALFALVIFPIAVQTRLPRASSEAQVALEITP